MEQSNRFTYPKSKLALFREDGEIYLTICRSPMVKLERRKLIRVALTIDNKELRLPEFTSGADKLTLTAPGGEVEFCFEDAACLRIRGCGNLALRFYMDGIEQFENGAPREDGSIEAAYIALGKLLFVPLSGALWHDAKWIPAKAQSEDYSVMLLPSVETNGFECAVHEYFSNGTRSETYKPFDACVTAAARDFAEFQAKFADCGFDPLNIWRQQSETGFFVDKLESTRQFEGFAADYLLSHQSPIRTRAAGDFPVYYHSNETGFPEFAEFPTSAPVKAPDLLTWLALRSDVEERERLINLLTSELWRGGKFVFLNAKTGEECNADSPLRFVPLAIGNQLPANITDALRRDFEKFKAANSEREEYAIIFAVLRKALKPS